MSAARLLELPLADGPHQIGDDLIFQWLANRHIASLRLMAVTRQAVDDCATLCRAVVIAAGERSPLIMADLRTNRAALTPHLRRNLQEMREVAERDHLDTKLAIVLCDGAKRTWFINAASLLIASKPGAYTERLFHDPQEALAWLKSFIKARR